MGSGWSADYATESIGLALTKGVLPLGVQAGHKGNMIERVVDECLEWAQWAMEKWTGHVSSSWLR